MTAQALPLCRRTDPHVCTFGRIHTTTLRERLLASEGVATPPAAARPAIPRVSPLRYARARVVHARPLTLWEAIELDHRDP